MFIFFQDVDGNGERVVLHYPETPCDAMRVSPRLDSGVVYDFVLFYYLFKSGHTDVRGETVGLLTGINPYSELMWYLSKVVEKYKVICDSRPEEAARRILNHLNGLYRFRADLQIEGG